MVAEPFVVGGDDVPGRPRGAAFSQGVLIGAGVVVPVLALLEIVQRQLPIAGGILHAGQESLLLLLLANVQEKFQDGDAAGVQHAFEFVDVPVALRPNFFGNQAVDAGDEHVFVVRTVEDSDIASARYGFVNSPEEIVRQLFVIGLLEGGDFAALGIHARHDVADGAVFAGGVAALQHDEQGVTAVGVEQVLEFAKTDEGLFLSFVVAAVAEGCGGVAMVEADCGAGWDDGVVGEGHGSEYKEYEEHARVSDSVPETNLSMAEDTLVRAISLKHGLTSHDVWQGHGAHRHGQQNNVR